MLLAVLASGCRDSGATDSDNLDIGNAQGGIPNLTTKLPPSGPLVWDWQIGAATDKDISVPAGVKLLDLDGFTTSAQTVTRLKAQGIYTVCYINAGSYEPYRPDAARYPASLKLHRDPDWPDEFFVDVSDVFRPNSVLATILNDRLAMCRAKGFDAVEPDNLQNDENVPGGQITLQQQLDFNGWIADAAHAHNLAVFQKNGPDKILLRDRTGKLMVDKFDAILNEECRTQSECQALTEYTKRGKLALNVEYLSDSSINDTAPSTFLAACPEYADLNLSELLRDRNLAGGQMSSYQRTVCP